MKDKTIIGLGYVPGNAKAICLKTDSETTLGNTEYTIIADPYSRLFTKKEQDPFTLFKPFREVAYEAMAVNVLDTDTGLTYAVKYNPDKLVRKPKAYEWSDVEILVGGRRLPVVPLDRAMDGGRRTHGKSIQACLESIVNTVTADCMALPKCPSKLIGTIYNPDGLRALDLSTRTWENLGSREYRVVSEPYAKKFVRPQDAIFDITGWWNTEHVWVNVMDEVTERTYAVQFVPARVCKNDDAAKIPSFDEIWRQCMARNRKREHQNDPVNTPKNPTGFLLRAREIIDELDAMMKADPAFGEKFGVAFVANRKDGNGKTSSGLSFFGGSKELIKEGLLASCVKDHNVDLAKMLVDVGGQALPTAMNRKASTGIIIIDNI